MWSEWSGVSYQAITSVAVSSDETRDSRVQDSCDGFLNTVGYCANKQTLIRSMAVTIIQASDTSSCISCLNRPLFLFVCWSDGRSVGFAGEECFFFKKNKQTRINKQIKLWFHNCGSALRPSMSRDPVAGGWRGMQIKIGQQRATA